MAGAARQTDISNCPADAHGCIGCPHNVQGPAITGSSDVFINNLPALRAQGTDHGIHAVCCGPNSWQTLMGSSTVFINGSPAVRIGDQTKHCGGMGQIMTGSADVDIG